MEHGEWPWETQARGEQILARREVLEPEKRERERAEQRAAYETRLLMPSYQPRSLEEILTTARMFP